MGAQEKAGDVSLDSQPNPIKTTNIFSKVFFCWLLPIFRYGYRHPLERRNLYQTIPGDSSEQLADNLAREWEHELERERATGKKPSLLRAIMRTCWVLLFLNGILIFFVEGVFKMLQPLLIAYLVQYFATDSGITTQQAYLCALGICLCTIGATVLIHPAFFISSRIGMRVRIGVSALVYRKALKLSSSALGKTTVGQLVNILTNDVNRFDMAFLFVHYVWIGPIQIAVMVAILWSQMGPPCLIAFFTLLLLAPIQSFMGRMFSKLRAKIALLTDERVRVMNEIIAGMRIIKIHAWETPFTQLVEEARKRECRHIQRTSHLRAFNLSFFFVSSKMIAFTTFTLFAALGNTLATSLVFLTLPLFDVVRLTLTLFLPYCVMYSLEGMVSIRRIKKFLLMEEIPASTNHLDHEVSEQNQLLDQNGVLPEKDIAEPGSNGNLGNHKTSTVDPEGDAMVVVDGKDGVSYQKPQTAERKGREDQFIQIRDLAGSWDDEDTKNKCLDQINFTVKPGELVAIIGPVGCGKSSLFMAFLGELPHTTGHISYKGRVAYTSQQPWVFSGTLKENVLFGRPYNKKKYSTALSVCALTRDIAILPDGDQTLIGERGVTLSGGQRARVSLARAVYDDADIYLLDDPLSAVDTAVGRHLFDRCIARHLRKKSVILVTHQLQYLSAVDKIIILKEGRMVDCGTYEELQTHGFDFAALLKEYENEEKAEGVSRAHSVISGGSEATSPEDVALADDYSEVDDKETKMEGSLSGGVYLQYFKAGSGMIPFIFFMGFNVTSQIFAVMTDWFLSEWAYIEESCTAQYDDESCLHNSTVLSEFTDFRVETVGRSFFFYVWSTFFFFLVAFTFIRTIWLFFICVTASRNLHNQMFATIIRTRMQFFDTNPIGRILNRFSKDIGYMDELLPITLSDFNAIALSSIAIVVTICIFNPLVLIFTVPLMIIFVFARTYYLATSRDVKRIEGICRSPVFSHLSSTLSGLTTVRAFHAQKRFVAKFDLYQDIHTESWFAFISTARWFGIVLDWLSATFLMLVTFGSVVSKDALGLDAAEVGLSLTYCLQLMGAFQWGVRQSAEVENLMTSTERVIEYTKLEPEAALESAETPDPDWPQEGAVEFDNVTLKYSEDGPAVLKEITMKIAPREKKKVETPDPDWPQEGAVEFDDVSLKYSEDGQAVLKGITMKIAPREKIGIVGRTGAGKSSLTVALMRLVEPSGSIKVDGVDLSELGLHDVRNNIAFIPQDPTLFSGTLRKNLDPFSEHEDTALWNSLKEVELLSVIEDYPEKLEMTVSEGGMNFSVGQRQLLCLARAILRKTKVLLVDEATANVDVRTDELIQDTIRMKFSDCTVFTIAHRLNTIMDSDRVLVLDEGRVIELDEPYLLLQDGSSLLSQMVAETGKQESAKLTALARRKHFHIEVDEGDGLEDVLDEQEEPGDGADAREESDQQETDQQDDET